MKKIMFKKKIKINENWQRCIEVCGSKNFVTISPKVLTMYEMLL